ncbi:aspartate/glutamate racemase family protein [Candidatus Uhrbacteria bacterium]|nr:aspartate/glutamate racemase family protein [Candidatus Uhrbacteria bacterium]
MIGIFDSGIGGLGVAKEIRKKAPQADLVYFGDLANLPYGPKKTEELFGLTLRAMTFLQSHGATQFVSACNSVSVSVIAPLIDIFGTPKTRVIEMITPASRVIHDRCCGKILVAATLATVRSGMYVQALAQQGCSVEAIALSDLASAIERKADKKEIEIIIAPAIQKAIEIQAQMLVFGCTQYPFARSIFESSFKKREYKIELFDPSEAVADEVSNTFDVNGKGLNTFFVSKSSAIFDQVVTDFFNSSVVDISVEKQCNANAFHTCAFLSK